MSDKKTDKRIDRRRRFWYTHLPRVNRKGENEMKKMMIVIAVMSAGGLALADDAQVYEMQLTMKTTVTQSGKVKFVACDCPVDSSTLYRKQGNVRIKGLIWGCGCTTLSDSMISTNSTSLAKAEYGYIFWNETTKRPMNLKFKWEFLNRIDKTAKKSEGTWSLTSEDGNFCVVGSGFGTVKDTTVKDPICMRTATWVPTMTGNFAGWSTPGAIVTVKATSGECSWCKKVEGTEEQTASAAGWSLCSCGDSDKRTAANGTWKLKYNQRASKALSSTAKPVESVTQVYAFPAYVKSVIE